ncbi:pyocin knob domain-containing protein [Yersinia enterocolitica]|uniref:pyocin knob domain-containing protein n=1 Tax=Yersinia enterocolitica TaxID=630 RepID=UPI00398D1BFC
MSWYEAGTVTSVAGTNVITGVGTLWNNPIFGITPGQMIFIPGSGQVVIYEILSVDSDTKIRVTKNLASAITNSEYAIVTTVSNSMSDLARRTAVQLALYQKLLEDWQDITTGTGDVTIIAPDGTEVVIPSLAQLSKNISNKLTIKSTFLSTDLNLAITSGVYHPTEAAENIPLPVLGVMEVYARQGGTSLVQKFHATVSTVGSVNRHFVRIGTLSSGVWTFSAWAEIYTSLTKPALTDLSGTLPVTNGGTGATTLAGAQSALGIVADAFGASQVANTPWNSLTILGGWEVGATYGIWYRKVFGTLQVRVNLNATTSVGSGILVATLPSGYRPMMGHTFVPFGQRDSAGSLYTLRLIIDQGGNIFLYQNYGLGEVSGTFMCPLQ